MILHSMRRHLHLRTTVALVLIKVLEKINRKWTKLKIRQIKKKLKVEKKLKIGKIEKSKIF